MLTNAKLVFNKNINEKHTEAAIKHAEYLCLQKQQKFTSLRRTVFEILWEDYQPLGAYEIKQRLSMRLGRKIDTREFIIYFVPAYAAYLLNRYFVGKDGKTPYERIKGKGARPTGLEFGEKLLYKKKKIEKMEKINIV